ncbi:GNAT family N-acetyltransferase [bacterium]|nr:GNAT family N-acetyltransferase [bacterium]
MIQFIQKKHIPEVIRIHKTCFPESQSTKFGDAFLTGYYEGHCESEHAVAFVSLEQNKVTGFITGGVNTRTLSREIINQSKWQFIKSAVVNFFRQPVQSIKKYSGYLKAYVLPKKKTFYSDQTSGLASIAVLPEYRGQGIAEQLTRAFLEELKKRGNKACRLGVEEQNTRARRFYEKIGFEQVNEAGSSYIYFFDRNFRETFFSSKEK